MPPDGPQQRRPRAPAVGGVARARPPAAGRAARGGEPPLGQKARTSHGESLTLARAAPDRERVRERSPA